MKKYSGNNTKSKGTILEVLKNTEKETTLFVNDHYFVLETENKFEFYYNPQHLWKKLDKNLINSLTIKYLTENCAIFKNFNPEKEIITSEGKNFKKYDNCFPETPEIGNHYSSLGNRIVTKENKYISFNAWGGCIYKNIKEIDSSDLLNLLYWSTETKTPNFKREIFTLDCFTQTKMKNTSNTIIGAIAGDIIGSIYEFNNTKDINFELFPARSKFTDDTVLSIAIADCIINDKNFAETVWDYGRKYRGRGYGGKFKHWLKNENPQPYGSYGNGSAMRVSAIGFAYENIETVLEKAKETAEITHNHKEGIKGAQAIASAIFLAKNSKTKQEIRKFITEKFEYNLDFTIDSIRPFYKFDVTCQGSVPQAINAFLESNDYENAIRLAISIGGDSDTIACMTGGIASAFYKEIPDKILKFAENKLPNEFIEILNEFDKRYIN